MARLKSKKFKKDYAAATSRGPEKGVWSGRGIAIPSLGAQDGSGDGSKYLGRPRRPWTSGELGSPSQSADSTFSSYFGRVNKGQDDYEGQLMFPEQEGEESDSYSIDDVNPISSKKVPRSFKVQRGISKFNENDIVENSRYSLASVFDEDFIENDKTDTGIVAINEGLANWAIMKGVPKAAKSAGLAIPGLDIALGTALAGWNLYSIKSASDRLVNDLNVPEDAIGAALSDDSESAWENVISHITIENTEELKVDFDDFLDSLKSLFFTLVQTLDTPITAGLTAATGPGVVPAEVGANTLTGITSFLGEMIPIERWLFDMSADGAGRVEDMVEFISSQGSESTEGLSEKMEEGGPIITAIMMSPARSFRRLGEFYRALHAEGEDTPQQAVVKGALKKAGSEFAGVDLDAIRQMVQSGEAMSNPEFSTLEELKRFISESIYPDYEALHPPRPEGYEYRRVPTVVSKQEEDQEFDVLDDYDDFSVSYKTDGGVLSSQSRNKLTEKALRRIIRRDISAILKESQKKK